MPRAVSLTFTEAINAAQTGEAFLILLELSSTEFDSADNPIRVTSDSVTTTSGGETYLPYPFNITLPVDDGETLPQADLTIDNIDRDILTSIRQVNDPIEVRIMIVLASDPDTVEIDLDDFELSQITYNAETITGSMAVNMFIDEPFPGDSFMPSNFPGLF
jgi:hypothetical protein